MLVNLTLYINLVNKLIRYKPQMIGQSASQSCPAKLTVTGQVATRSQFRHVFALVTQRPRCPLREIDKNRSSKDKFPDRLNTSNL